MVQYKKFKLDSLFDIQKVRGINKSGLTEPSDSECYDYITRTSKNNGIESYTGLVKSRELNEAGTFSLGLLQMTFFYRDKPWYAGQFVRKIVPKRLMTKEQLLYFLGVFQALRPLLSSVLVRKVDEVFSNAKIELPVTPAGDPDFEYMTMRIRELEAERIRELEAYLRVTGLDDTTLSASEAQALTQDVKWKRFRVGDLFNINTGSLVSSKELKKYPGNTPRISVTTENNGVVGYYDETANINNIRYYQNFISVNFFGNVFYHPEKASVEMKVHVLHLKSGMSFNRGIALYLVAALSQIFDNGTYNYGNQLSSSKLKKENYYVALPVTPTGDIDFDYMQDYIRAVEKQAVKGVVEYKDRVIAEAKKVVNG